ncbi:MAG TPA: LysE family translocator [Alphaproteobacteria bacterium]|nr:LysE family translocator [Alphaproteobacteria bacterium]
MTWEAILTFGLAVGALAIKPGAGMMAVMSRAISQGLPAVLMFALGFCVISILFLGLVAFGYKFVEVDLVFISILIKSLAAVYLIWLGVKGLMQVQDKYHVTETGPDTLFDNLSASLMLTLSNPLTIIFYAGIIPTILDVKTIGFMDFAALSMVIVIVEFAVAIAYSSPLLLYRKKVPDHFLKGLSYFSSVVIIMVGLYIGTTAFLSEEIFSVFNS